MKRQVLTTILAILIMTIIANAQSNFKQASARIFESQSAELSRIVLVYENGESEVIPLKNWKLFESVSSTNDILIANQKTINKFLNDMDSKGYEISQMTTTGEGFLYTFIIFTRKEK